MHILDTYAYTLFGNAYLFTSHCTYLLTCLLLIYRYHSVYYKEVYRPRGRFWYRDAVLPSYRHSYDLIDNVLSPAEEAALDHVLCSPETSYGDVAGQVRTHTCSLQHTSIIHDAYLIPHTIYLTALYYRCLLCKPSSPPQPCSPSSRSAPLKAATSLSTLKQGSRPRNCSGLALLRVVYTLLGKVLRLLLLLFYMYSVCCIQWLCT